MPDLESQLERAVELYLRGKATEAVEIGAGLLIQARATPQAARVYRHQAEFLHAAAEYEAAREMAEEAGSLARATQHPGEILATTLLMLACDLYLGHVAAVHQQLEELLLLAPNQPMPLAFMGQLMLLVGQFDRAIEFLEHARGLLDQASAPGQHPALELFRANLLHTQAKAFLVQGQADEAAGLLTRLLDMDLPTPVPLWLAQASLGLALLQLGQFTRSEALLEQADKNSRDAAPDIRGHCLLAVGQAHLLASELDLALQTLSRSIEALVHPIERQEAEYHLAQAAERAGDRTRAEAALKKATLPTAETHFGRLAVRNLRSMTGLQLLSAHR